MKKIAAAVIVALTPIFTWAQSLGDTIQLDVNGESIEATLAEQLSSPNSYRLTFDYSHGKGKNGSRNDQLTAGRA